MLAGAWKSIRASSSTLLGTAVPTLSGLEPAVCVFRWRIQTDRFPHLGWCSLNSVTTRTGAPTKTHDSSRTRLETVGLTSSGSPLRGLWFRETEAEAGLNLQL